MATKYIVDNIPNQTIQGNLIINGNLSVTGTSTTSMCSYKALLSQTGPIALQTDISGFNGQFLIGDFYTIDTYVAGDDFSNVANVIVGNINETGCQFEATGSTPTNWSNGSTLSSSGGFVINQIESNLGYDLSWAWNPFGGNGYYVAINNATGPISNSFPKLETQIFLQPTYTFPFFDGIGKIYPQVVNFMGINNVIVVDILANDGAPSDGLLYYTPIEIRIKQDMTPIVISGSVESVFPFNYVSTRILCDGNNIQSYYGDNTTVNNITELITQLNNDPDTNVMGTYSDAGDGGVLLTMTTHIANIFCPNGTLTFEVFAD